MRNASTASVAETKSYENAGLEMIRTNPASTIGHVSPPFRSMVPKPALGDFVGFVVPPRQRDQHIDIEKVGRHSNSDSSSFTRSVVILGESAGMSKTTTPLTM